MTNWNWFTRAMVYIITTVLILVCMLVSILIGLVCIWFALKLISGIGFLLGVLM